MRHEFFLLTAGELSFPGAKAVGAFVWHFFGLEEEANKVWDVLLVGEAVNKLKSARGSSFPRGLGRKSLDCGIDNDYIISMDRRASISTELQIGSCKQTLDQQMSKDSNVEPQKKYWKCYSAVRTILPITKSINEI